MTRDLPLPRTGDATHALHYVQDTAPGIRRKKNGAGWQYILPSGKQLTNEEERTRIASLAIPPAWTDVWICTDAKGHLQATGRDARGRKQYRYHPAWRMKQDETKFDHLVPFAEFLPSIREAVDADLRLRGLPRKKVIAAVVWMLDTTHLRIGNEEYARENHSYGITTLKARHAEISGMTVRLRFRGKSGQQQDVSFADRRLARILSRCADLPGQELLCYNENGQVHDIGSHDVNDYLDSITKASVTAKDFRTWGGTTGAALHLFHHASLNEKIDSHALQQAEKDAVNAVAKMLGNRPATCRKYYIDPRIFTAFRNGTLHGTLTRSLSQPHSAAAWALSKEERAMHTLLSALQH